MPRASLRNTLLGLLLFSPCVASGTEDIGLPVLNSDRYASVVSNSVTAEHKLPSNNGTDSSAIESNPEGLTPLTAECIYKVSRGYGIHPDILFAILLVEGGELGKTNRGNVDGTKDLSLFQINEINLPELHESFGISRTDVLNDGCLGAAIAARHLLRSIKGAKTPTTRYEYLSLIARYHSKTPDKNAVYAMKLAEQFERLEQLELTYGNK